MRVFVTLGTHPQQFDRLLKKVDSIAARGSAKFYAQTGNSAYTPKHYSHKAFIQPGEFEKEFEKADIVISHGGAGAIINALRHRKPLIIVPRLKKFSEHTDNHQLDLAEAMDRRGKAIAVFDLAQLPEAIKKARKFKAKKKSERELLVKRIKQYLKGCGS